MIVVLRDQLRSTPVNRLHMSARTTRAGQSQHVVLSRLAGPSPTRVHHFSVANAFTATVTPAQAAALAGDPAVASVIRDSAIKVEPTVAAAPAGGTAKPQPRPGAPAPAGR